MSERVHFFGVLAGTLESHSETLLINEPLNVKLRLLGLVKELGTLDESIKKGNSVAHVYAIAKANVAKWLDYLKVVSSITFDKAPKCSSQLVSLLIRFMAFIIESLRSQRGWAAHKAVKLALATVANLCNKAQNRISVTDGPPLMDALSSALESIHRQSGPVIFSRSVTLSLWEQENVWRSAGIHQSAGRNGGSAWVYDKGLRQGVSVESLSPPPGLTLTPSRERERQRGGRPLTPPPGLSPPPCALKPSRETTETPNGAVHTEREGGESGSPSVRERPETREPVSGRRKVNPPCSPSADGSPEDQPEKEGGGGRDCLFASPPPPREKGRGSLCGYVKGSRTAVEDDTRNLCLSVVPSGSEKEGAGGERREGEPGRICGSSSKERHVAGVEAFAKHVCATLFPLAQMIGAAAVERQGRGNAKTESQAAKRKRLQREKEKQRDSAGDAGAEREKVQAKEGGETEPLADLHVASMLAVQQMEASALRLLELLQPFLVVGLPFASVNTGETEGGRGLGGGGAGTSSPSASAGGSAAETMSEDEGENDVESVQGAGEGVEAVEDRVGGRCVGRRTRNRRAHGRGGKKASDQSGGPWFPSAPAIRTATAASIHALLRAFPRAFFDKLPLVFTLPGVALSPPQEGGAWTSGGGKGAQQQKQSAALPGLLLLSQREPDGKTKAALVAACCAVLEFPPLRQWPGDFEALSDKEKESSASAEGGANPQGYATGIIGSRGGHSVSRVGGAHSGGGGLFSATAASVAASVRNVLSALCDSLAAPGVERSTEFTQMLARLEGACRVVPFDKFRSGLLSRCVLLASDLAGRVWGSVCVEWERQRGGVRRAPGGGGMVEGGEVGQRNGGVQVGGTKERMWSWGRLLDCFEDAIGKGSTSLDAASAAFRVVSLTTTLLVKGAGRAELQSIHTAPIKTPPTPLGLQKSAATTVLDLPSMLIGIAGVMTEIVESEMEKDMETSGLAALPSEDLQSLLESFLLPPPGFEDVTPAAPPPPLTSPRSLLSTSLSALRALSSFSKGVFGGREGRTAELAVDFAEMQLGAGVGGMGGAILGPLHRSSEGVAVAAAVLAAVVKSSETSRLRATDLAVSSGLVLLEEKFESAGKSPSLLKSEVEALSALVRLLAVLEDSKTLATAVSLLISPSRQGKRKAGREQTEQGVLTQQQQQQQEEEDDTVGRGDAASKAQTTGLETVLLCAPDAKSEAEFVMASFDLLSVAVSKNLLSTEAGAAVLCRLLIPLKPTAPVTSEQPPEQKEKGQGEALVSSSLSAPARLAALGAVADMSRLGLLVGKQGASSSFHLLGGLVGDRPDVTSVCMTSKAVEEQENEGTARLPIPVGSTSREGTKEFQYQRESREKPVPSEDLSEKPMPPNPNPKLGWSPFAATTASGLQDHLLDHIRAWGRDGQRGLPKGEVRVDTHTEGRRVDQKSDSEGMRRDHTGSEISSQLRGGETVSPPPVVGPAEHFGVCNSVPPPREVLELIAQAALTSKGLGSCNATSPRRRTESEGGGGRGIVLTVASEKEALAALRAAEGWLEVLRERNNAHPFSVCTPNLDRLVRLCRDVTGRPRLVATAERLAKELGIHSDFAAGTHLSDSANN